jgi:hypothetical protein
MSLGLGMLGMSLAGKTGGDSVPTPPVLTSPVDTVNGPTAATGTVTTDIGNGTLYWEVLLTADSTPTAGQVKLGLKSDGVTPGASVGSQAVGGTGVQTLSPAPTLLTPATGYKIVYMHQSAAGGQSDVSVADGFTTANVLLGTLIVGQASITNPTIAVGSVAVLAGDVVVATYSEQTGVGTSTGATDNLGNTYTAANAGLTSSSTSARTFYTIVTAPGTLTAVNIACTGSTNDVAVTADVFKGPFSAIDALPAVKTDNASPYTGTITPTLAQASELVIGAIAHTSASGTLSANGGFTMAGTPAATGLRRASHQYLNVSATTAVTPSFSGTADNTVVQTLSFKRSV